MGFLANKKFLVVGLASDRSIAHGIAAALHREGATLALTYQNDKLKSRVEKMALEWDAKLVIPCDVSQDADIENVAQALEKHWGKLDGVIHSVAFAPQEQLEGEFFQAVTREGFRVAHDISAYSFCALAKALYPLLNPEASLLTLSYYGAEKAVPSYNVMGLAKASLEASVRYLAQSLGPHNIRVNAISAGPIKTLAAMGIKGMRAMLNQHQKVSPLRRNVDTDEVGNAAAFLCSSLARGITGEVLHVDSGYHAVAMGSMTEEEA